MDVNGDLDQGSLVRDSHAVRIACDWGLALGRVASNGRSSACYFEWKSPAQLKELFSK